MLALFFRNPSLLAVPCLGALLLLRVGSDYNPCWECDAMLCCAVPCSAGLGVTVTTYAWSVIHTSQAAVVATLSNVRAYGLVVPSASRQPFDAMLACIEPNYTSLPLKTHGRHTTKSDICVLWTQAAHCSKTLHSYDRCLIAMRKLTRLC